MRRLVGLILALMLMAAPSVYASENIWLDRHSNALVNAQKIVIYPLQGAEVSGSMNDYLLDRAVEKVRKTSWLKADFYGLAFIADEEESVRAAKTKPYGDLYVVPIIRQYDTQTDYSPEREVSVQVKGWMEYGDMRFHSEEQAVYGTEDVLIPAQQVTLDTVVVDFLVYDNSGKLVMAYNDMSRGYDGSREAYLESIISDFCDEYKRSVKWIAKNRQ